MFVEAADPDAGLAVWLFTGASNSDDDYAASIDCIARQGARLAGSAHIDRPAALQVVDDGNPIPGPHWRKGIAEASRHIDPRAIFGLVTTSTLVRGVVVAINWMRPPPYLVGVHATFDEGVRWVEKHRGPTPHLHTLLAQARARAAAPTAMSTTTPTSLLHVAKDAGAVAIVVRLGRRHRHQRDLNGAVVIPR